MATYRFTDDSTIEIQATSSLHAIGSQTNRVTGQAVVAVEDGEILLDPPPAGYLEVPIEALQSGHRLADLEMRRRVEAKRFPTIRYELQETTGRGDRFLLTGSLTFHGVTRCFNQEITARVDNGVLHVDGEHTFDVRDFDVTPVKVLTLQVYPEVRVAAHLVALEA